MPSREQGITLSKALGQIKSVLTGNVQGMWIRAEIARISPVTKNRPVYVELTEKGKCDQVVASSKAIISPSYHKIMTKFTQCTGTSLSAGLCILIYVEVTFSQIYGFSFTIKEIDASFTLGELAQKKDMIRQRLKDEQLYGLNKQLDHPFDIRQIIVISPQHAAGLEDFKQGTHALELHQVCKFHYYYSVFQGATASRNIIDALRLAAQEWHGHSAHNPDLIVIIRGGGAAGDLVWLNDWELAQFIAKKKVPVWTGIGHERDNCILDEIAHRNFGTPSKVIEEIKQCIVARAQEIKVLMAETADEVKRKLEHSRQFNDKHILAIKELAHRTIVGERQQIGVMQNSIVLDLRQHMSRHRLAVKQDILQTKELVYNLINQEKNKIGHDLTMTLSLSPKHLLGRGYAIVHDGDGKTVTSTGQLNRGDPLEITVQDGTIKATVERVQHE